MSGCGQWCSYLDRIIRLIWSVGTTPKKVNIDTKIICSGWYGIVVVGVACVACVQAIHLWRANVRRSPPHALAFPLRNLSRLRWACRQAIVCVVTFPVWAKHKSRSKASAHRRVEPLTLSCTWKRFIRRLEAVGRITLWFKFPPRGPRGMDIWLLYAPEPLALSHWNALCAG